MRKASVHLEAFIDETIKRAHEKGYFPTAFVSMRQKLGTIPAITKLVRSGDIQSGFKRLNKLGLLKWTIEAAVEHFPTEFNSDDLECASFRLSLARKEDQSTDQI